MPSYPPAGTNTAGLTISTDVYKVEDIETLLLEVHDELENIYDTLHTRVEELEQMQSKHLDTFCEEIGVILKQTEEIQEAVNSTIINNTTINDKFTEHDRKMMLKMVNQIGG